MHRNFCMPVLLLLGAGSIMAQPAVCVTSATPPLVRAEGLTERIGDILLACTGTTGNTLNANVTVGLNTNLTNRVSTSSTVTGVVFTIDSGLGPQPVLTPPLLVGPSTLAYNGVNLTFSAQGAVNLLSSPASGPTRTRFLLPRPSLLLSASTTPASRSPTVRSRWGAPSMGFL